MLCVSISLVAPTMVPEKLRTLSWWAFKASIYCDVLAALLVVSIPDAGYRDSADLTVRFIVMTAFGLVGIAFLSTVVSLVSGAFAWINGAGRCYWIIFCAVMLLIPTMLFFGLQVDL